MFKELKPNSFIFEIPKTLPVDVCKEMIRRFEENEDQQYQGRIGQNASEDNQIKKTTDLVISNKDNWKDIDNILTQSLGKAFSAFRMQYPFFKGPFKDMGYGMQRYLPGEYYHWHIDGGSHSFMERQLVAIWYLNDVNDGGTTDFLFQDLKVKPEQGKLLLFPPFWTHEHRAAELLSGVKYIATTWICFA